MLLLLSSCTEVGLFALNSYANLDGQEIIRDISYGQKSYQVLNLYRPERGRSVRGVVVFFYGGGWSSGSKDEYDFVAEAFTSNGFVAVIPDYAKYPQYKYPTAVEDGAKVIRWVLENEQQIGEEKRHIFVSGHSAGGHLGAMLCTNPRFLQKESISREFISGFVGLAGPYDFKPYEPKYVDYFSPAHPDVSTAMPASYVDGSQPPMLLIYGLKDDVVGKVNLDSMHRQVELRGGEIQLGIFDELDHVDVVVELSSLLGSEHSVLEKVLTFLSQQIARQST